MLSIRAATAVCRLPTLRPQLVPSRTYATEQSANPTTTFYRTFSRPIAKVMILAVFTYQVAYWTWSKLEADEACGKIHAEIETLEQKVNDYKDSKAVVKAESEQGSAHKV